MQHNVPKNTLTNGVLYKVTIRVKGVNGSLSDISDSILFYCYSQPTFDIIGIVADQTVLNSSHDITLTYNQIENEPLQSYQVMLYDSLISQIWTSGVKYDTTNMVIKLSDLGDNKVYSIRATGLTLNGMALDTGYITFSVNFIMPEIYAYLNLENKVDEGSIKIQSNIISLEGQFYGGGTPNYLEDNFINLIKSPEYVVFDQGFSIPNNFTINLVGDHFADYSTILQLSNGDKTIVLTKNKGIYISENNVEKEYFELRVNGEFAHYVIRSDYISITTNSNTLARYSIWLRRIDNLYDISVEKSLIAV